MSDRSGYTQHNKTWLQHDFPRSCLLLNHGGHLFLLVVVLGLLLGFLDFFSDGDSLGFEDGGGAKESNDKTKDTTAVVCHSPTLYEIETNLNEFNAALKYLQGVPKVPHRPKVYQLLATL